MKNTNKLLGITLLLSLACGLATTPLKAQDLYVPVYGNPQGVGEYALNGSTVSGTLISAFEPQGIAISGNDLFLSQENGIIGEYTLAGAPINSSLITS